MSISAAVAPSNLCCTRTEPQTTNKCSDGVLSSIWCDWLCEMDGRARPRPHISVVPRSFLVSEGNYRMWIGGCFKSGAIAYDFLLFSYEIWGLIEPCFRLLLYVTCLKYIELCPCFFGICSIPTSTTLGHRLDTYSWPACKSYASWNGIIWELLMIDRSISTIKYKSMVCRGNKEVGGYPATWERLCPLGSKLHDDNPVQFIVRKQKRSRKAVYLSLLPWFMAPQQHMELWYVTTKCNSIVR